MSSLSLNEEEIIRKIREGTIPRIVSHKRQYGKIKERKILINPTHDEQNNVVYNVVFVKVFDDKEDIYSSLGRYASKDEAEFVKNKFEEVGYCKGELNNALKMKGIYSLERLSFEPKGGSIYLEKSKKGKTRYTLQISVRRKVNNYKKYRAGSYPTYEDAEYVLEELRKVGFDKSYINQFREERGLKPIGKKGETPVNIFKQGDSAYYIHKSIDGTCKYYGSYNTVEDAKRIRDELEKVNWDKTQLNDILKKTGITGNKPGRRSKKKREGRLKHGG